MWYNNRGQVTLVAVAAEVRGTGTGRIRLHRTHDSSAESLVGFVKQALEPGSVVVTDGLPSYLGLEAAGYRHRQRVVRGRRQRLTACCRAFIASRRS